MKYCARNAIIARLTGKSFVLLMLSMAKVMVLIIMLGLVTMYRNTHSESKRFDKKVFRITGTAKKGFAAYINGAVDVNVLDQLDNTLLMQTGTKTHIFYFCTHSYKNLYLFLEFLQKTGIKPQKIGIFYRTSVYLHQNYNIKR